MSRYFKLPNGRNESVSLCLDCAVQEPATWLHPDRLTRCAVDIEPGEEVRCDECGMLVRNEGREVAEEPCSAFKRNGGF